MAKRGLIKRMNQEAFSNGDTAAVSQFQAAYSHPFSQLERYVPLSRGENRLYEAIREAVPLVDAAIGKIVALVGGFSVECESTAAQRGLSDFLKNVPVGGVSVGIDSFLSQHLEQLLMYGTAVGEIIPNRSRSGIAAICNAPLEGIEIERCEPFGAAVCYRQGAELKRAEYQNLILLTALNPLPGEVCGHSLLKGLPFVTGVLLKIYNTIGINFERVGNVRFAVTYKPAGDSQSGATARERAQQIASEWSKAMRENNGGAISDFVAVGDVDIKVIGADNQILDCAVPSRLMLEQIVSKTGLPPFMLGLSWSTTERMSTQQADILTSELWAYRRTLTPVISKICNMWLRLNGYYKTARILWENISLMDEVELAKAELIRMQAAQIAEKLEVNTASKQQ